VSDLGRFVDGDTAHLQRLVSAPPELVWEYLTNSEALPEWLGHGEIAKEVGGKVMLRSGGPIIRGTVREFEPQQRLAYTWNVFMPMDDNPMAPESTLRFVLEPHGQGTLLTVTQGPIAPEYRARTIAGWHVLLEILMASAAGEQAPDFMETYEAVAGDYELLYGQRQP
jgi:uncharacterized protein YndB with AHSA1/START domain